MDFCKKFLLLLALGTVVTVSAAIKLPAFFSDHAVLARHKEVPVFGKADPGEKVTVSFGGKSVSVTADEQGNFMAVLDLSDAPSAPQELKVNDLVIKDVLAGGVFLASGQSNMNRRMNLSDSYADEVKLPGNDRIRFFIVNTTFSTRPEKNISGRWIKASPENLRYLSAVAYHFAKRINQTAGVPVGILQSSVGGTPVEAWMSKAAISRFPNAARVGRERNDAYNQYPAKYKKFLADQAAWEKKFQRADIAAAALPADTVWQPLPRGGVIPGNGVVWLRNSFSITPAEAEKGFHIRFRATFSPFSIWIDGKKIAETGDKAWDLEGFAYFVRGGTLKPGKHEVTLRFHVSRNYTRLRTPIQFGRFTVRTPWQYYRQHSFGKLDRKILAAAPALPGKRIRAACRWSVLYNAMINPFVPVRLTGVIWYQGESNTSRAWEYGKLFPGMIVDWREKFNDPQLPFYFVMLAPYLNKTADPGSTGEQYAELRASQIKALALPNTGVAVISDAGEARDIHPLDKKTPGERLAALALKHIYGKDVPCFSPTATHAKVSQGKVTVFFDHTYGSLTATEIPPTQHLCKLKKQTGKLVRTSPAAQLEGFTLKDQHGKWHWAEKAEITGKDQVTVSSTNCPEPVMIRYNYQNNPTCNLFNQAGFPAVPFELRLK